MESNKQPNVLPATDVRSVCPICGDRPCDEVLFLPEVPVNCSALWPNKTAALECAKGSIELRMCTWCGLIFNAKFDSSALEYDTQYDNSLDFSPAFRTYARDLAHDLVTQYHLRNKRVAEIGCGNGTFLKLLCSEGRNRGIGYDPTFPGDTNPTSGVEFVREYFEPGQEIEQLDFLCCRHVLEHLERPLEFLQKLAGVEAPCGKPAMYFEVPNGEFVLCGEGQWDVIYPHVSYFTEASLVNLFERAGFEVLRSGKRYSNQFLFIEVRADAASRPKKMRKALGEAAEIESSIKSFRSRFESAILAWSGLVSKLASDASGPVAFWGAGAKGVTFLNLVPGARNIGVVIDSNPRKQGKFVPGSGQRIVGPEELKRVRPSAVLLLNPVYRGEVGATLAAQGVSARLVSRPHAAAAA